MTLSDEQIQDLLRVGNPTDEECRLIRTGWDAAMRTKSAPDVDALAQFIREVDGKHQLGAGVLAERIVEWLAAAPEAKP